MAVMAPPDCLKWPETPQPRPGYIKKYISCNIDLATIVVLISNFTQPPVKPCLQAFLALPFILLFQDASAFGLDSSIFIFGKECTT